MIINNNRAIFLIIPIIIINILVLPIYFVNHAWAEDIVQAPVIVTAQGINVENQTKQTMVISSEDIAKSQAKTLVEALKSIPGVIVHSYGMYQNASVYIKGASPHSTIILINGVKIDTPAASSFDFGQIPLTSVDRIEIIQGSSAIAYSSNASAGVINIITKKATPQDKEDNSNTNNIKSILEYGSRNYIYADLGYLSASENSSFTIFFGHQQSDGYSFAYPSNSQSEKDAYGVYNILTSYSYKNLEALLQINYSDTDVDPIGRGGLIDSPNYAVEKINYNSYIKLADIQLLGLSNNFNLSGSLTQSDEEKIMYIRGRPTDITENFNGSIVTFNYNNLYNYNDVGFIKSGLDYNFNSLEKYTLRTTATEIKTTYPYASQFTYSLYTTAGYRFFDVLDLNAGLRYNQYGDITAKKSDVLSMDQHYKVDVNNKEKFNYNLGISYIVDQNYKLRVNYADSYKVQSLYEFYRSTNDLLTEHNSGFDVGLDTIFADRYTLNISYFNQKVTNLISFDPFADSFYNDNNTINTQGFVIDNKNVINNYINFSLGYTYLVADDILARRPKHNFTSNVEIKPIDKLSFFIEYYYVGDTQDGTPTTGYIPFDSYHLVNSKLEYSFAGNVSTYIKATNLFDTKYQNAYGFATEGLGVYVGLVWK